MIHSQLFTKQRAFTLIELLVVILIIGILIAVAAPSFLGQQDKAYDSSVKQTLTVVRKEAKSAYISNDAVHPALGPVVTAGTILNQFKASEPQYSFVEYPVSIASTTNISVSRDTDSQITACKQSKSGVIFCLSADEAVGLEQIASSGGTLFGAETAYAAGKTDVAYSTATGATTEIAEAAARCLLDGAREVPEDPACSTEGAAAGWSEISEGEAPSPVTPAPVNSVLPVVTGTAVAGHTLSATAGVWTNATTFTYQWQRGTPGSFTDIDGATTPTYTLTNADGGKNVQVVVTAVGYTPAVRATSMITASVVGPPSASVAPSITGNLATGETLTASNGTWSENGVFTYQWYIDGDAVDGETSQTYVIRSGDYTKKASVRVGNSVDGGPIGYSTSHETASIVTAPSNTIAPTISGSQIEGSLLTADRGTWSNANSYAYLWQREVEPGHYANISFAESSTYTTTGADVGKRVRVSVYAYGDSGTITTVHSAGVEISGVTSNTSAPTISGSDTAGSTLTASQGTWSYPGSSYDYQWQRANSTGGPWTDISNTTTSYTVVAGDEGKYLRVRVTTNGVTANSSTFSIPVPVVNVTNAYTSAVTSDNPTGYWRIDGSSTVPNSSGGSAGAATRSGTVTAGDSPLNGFGSSGSPSAVMGSGSYSIPSSSSVSPSGTDSYSIEFWFKSRGSTGSEQFLIEKYGTGYAIRVDTGVYCNSSGGRLGLLYVSPAACAGVTGSTNYHTGNAWHHFVVTRSGSTVTMYVDGAVSSTTTTASNPSAGSSPLRIGARGDDGALGYNGSMAEVAFYNSALSASRVSAHYTASGR